MATFWKPVPRKLVKAARQKGERSYYLRQRQIALTRDHRHCRICGAERGLETHHVERRSSSGPKQKVHSDHHSNLLTVCAGLRQGVISCHAQLTGNVMFAYSDPVKGTNGKVMVTRFDANEGGQVVFRKAA